MEKLIGRREELAELCRCRDSERAEFVVVYGRRRIGKTFLVRHFFGDRYAFSYVGIRGVTLQRQLESFAAALKQYSGAPFAPRLNNWFEAFAALRELLEHQHEEERQVVFIDEMPWMDSVKSDFVSALENFWNGWASTRSTICLVVCGSATSWIADKLIYNTGGLHNRITSRIYLRPFTLSETESYLVEHGCAWDHYQMAQCYMVLGGVPYYLSLLRSEQSLAQNIDRLFFRKNAELREEFRELYYSLFKNATPYIDVVSALAERRNGMTRQEISTRVGLSGGGLTKILDNLERCDFVLGYNKFGLRKNSVVYRLSDFYTLFYLHFVASDRTFDEQFWQHNMASQRVVVWQGYSFELLCMLHLRQVKQALGISGIATTASTWRSSGDHPYQIDMIIDRADRLINLCEMKFSTARYIIDRDYEQRLRDRTAVFVHETKTRKTPVVTLITTYGVMPGQHAGVVQSEVLLDDLFREII